MQYLNMEWAKVLQGMIMLDYKCQQGIVKGNLVRMKEWNFVQLHQLLQLVQYFTWYCNFCRVGVTLHAGCSIHLL